MKTIVIWDDCQANLRFFVVPYNCSHLNGKYVNSTGCSDGEEAEITEMTMDGDIPKPMLDEFPLNEFQYMADDGHICHDTEVKVIVCGFLP
jgi:hypothetical protein